MEEGDHITYLNGLCRAQDSRQVFNAFVESNKSVTWCHGNFLNHKALTRAVSIRHQLQKYLYKFQIPMKSCGEDMTVVRKCLVGGYFANAARAKADGSYVSVRDNVPLMIHPSSVLFTRAPPCVLYHEVVTTKQAYMRDVTVIEIDWLAELAPHFYEMKDKRKTVAR